MINKILTCIFLLVIIIFTTTYHTSANRYYAKGSVHYNNRQKFSYYNIDSYDRNTDKLIKTRQIDEFNRLISYSKYDYSSDGLLIKKTKYSSKDKFLSSTSYIYNDKNKLSKSVEHRVKSEALTKYFTFKYANNRLLYKEIFAFKGLVRKKKNFDYVKRITYNLNGYPKRVEYFKPLIMDNKKIKLRLIWYEDIIYKSGRRHYVIRFGDDEYIRVLVKYKYDNKRRIANIIVYEGYTRFIGYRYDYKLKLNISQRIKFAYIKPKTKKPKKIIKIKKPKKIIKIKKPKKIINRKKPSYIEIIFDDLLEDDSIEIIEESRQKIKKPKKVDKPIVKVKKPKEADKPIVKVKKPKEADKPIVKVEKPKTKELLEWVLNINKAFTSKPYYYNSAIYLGIIGNKLISISRSGRVKWEITVEGDVKSIIGNKGLIYIGTNKGLVYRVRPMNGKVVWKKKNSYSKGFYIYNSRLITINKDNEVMALRLKTGKLLWKLKYKDNIVYSPIGRKNIVMVFSRNMGLAIDVKNGKRLWKKKYTNSIINQPVLMGDNIIAGFNNGLAAWSYNNFSKQKWFIKDINITSSIFVYKNSIYLGTDEGKLLKIRTKDGYIYWERLTNKVNFYLTIDNKFIYMTHKGDNITLINHNGIEDNNYIGIYGEAIITPVIVVDNGKTVFYGTSSWKLYRGRIY